jgi:simple sugar transport system permease protein
VQNVGLAIYGVNFRSVPAFIPSTNVIEIGGISYAWDKLASLMVVVPLLLLLTWFVRQTRQGKAMRAVAQDREASAMMGIDVNRTISVTFAIAGALAGAAGAFEVAGVTGRLYQGLSPGYGYTAIAVALLARLHPLAVIPSALFFGALEAGAGAMQREAGIPAVATEVVQGVVILLSVGFALSRRGA